MGSASRLSVPETHYSAGRKLTKLRGPTENIQTFLTPIHFLEFPMPSGIERVREIKRLRTRRKKVAKLLARAKAGTMDKSEVVRKLKRLTPGADVIIEREGLKS